MLQPAVLIFQALQALRFADFHAAVLALPRVDCRFADSVLARQIRHFLPRFMPLQNANHLFFAESSLLHPCLLVPKSYRISDQFQGPRSVPSKPVVLTNSLLSLVGVFPNR